MERSKPEPKQKLHDTLVRRTSVKAMQSEYIVEKIIAHQHKSVNRALKTNLEVEISGFCKFILSQKKLERKIKRVEYMLSTFQERLKLNPDDKEAIYWIDTNIKNLSLLKSKIKETEPDENRFQGVSRRDQKLILSKEGDQGINRENSRGEDSNLQTMPILLSEQEGGRISDQQT